MPPRAAVTSLWRSRDGWIRNGSHPPKTKPEVAAQLSQIVDDYSGWHFVHVDLVLRLTPPANKRLAEILGPTLIILGELDLPFFNHPLADRLEQGINLRKESELAKDRTHGEHGGARPVQSDRFIIPGVYIKELSTQLEKVHLTQAKETAR
jgi:hypothetical protein